MLGRSPFAVRLPFCGLSLTLVRPGGVQTKDLLKNIATHIDSFARDPNGDVHAADHPPHVASAVRRNTALRYDLTSVGL